MKLILFLFPTLLFGNYVSKLEKADYGVLLKPDEKVLYGFTIKSSNKVVLICTQKDDKYIVYRFGTKDKVELQYPAVLNASSWKAFKYNGYSRGGPNNSPTELHSLSFKNNNVNYEIDDDWDGDENEHDAEIIVHINGKQAKIKGNATSINGTLGVLMQKTNLIHNYYWEDNK